MSYDLDFDSDEGSKYTRRFIMWPERWMEFPEEVSLTWKSIKYTEDNLASLPDKTGIYAFIAKPEIANLGISYLMYIGKAEKQSLLKRCPQYTQELKKEKGRPLIKQMLVKWAEHLFLYFSEVDKDKTSKVEEHLLAAFMPPANTQLPGKLTTIAKSIYRG